MSNDLKYVLLPSINDERQPPKFQPWYRERIRMKYPCNINTRNWKFVRDGLDDFRDGLPPPHENVLITPEKGPEPPLISQTRRVKSSVSNVGKRLQDHQIYFSREIPAAEKRRQAVDNNISALLDQPMTFFSHFSETLAPNVYQRISRLLEIELSRSSNGDERTSYVGEQKDIISSSPSAPITRDETSHSGKSTPEFKSQHTDKIIERELTDEIVIEEDDKQTEKVEEPQKRNEEGKEEDEDEDEDSKSKGGNSTRLGRSGFIYDEAGNEWNAEEYEKKQKNPYRWYIEKQREKEKSTGPSQAEKAASAMEARLRDVSEQFCSWLRDLTENGNDDVEPAVVRNLFSTAYDTKPSLSVPIKIVEMTRIPPELREGVQDTMTVKSAKTKRTLSEMRMATTSAKSRGSASSSGNQQSSAQKYRYGAWYLPKSLWQRSLATQELRDPKVVKAEQEDQARKSEQEANALLAPLHCVNAFKDYLIDNRAHRLPKLISDVEEYRRNNQRDAAKSAVEPSTKRTGLTSP